jgi:alpha-beta hydrolase superfamily lysophospholipase
MPITGDISKAYQTYYTHSDVSRRSASAFRLWLRRLGEGYLAWRYTYIKEGDKALSTFSIDHDRRRRSMVEQQHDLREHAVASAEIDDAAAAKQAAHTSRHFPCFVQLLPGQTAGGADRAGDAIEQRCAGETVEIACGEPGFGGWRELH